MANIMFDVIDKSTPAAAAIVSTHSNFMNSYAHAENNSATNMMLTTDTTLRRLLRNIHKME